MAPISACHSSRPSGRLTEVVPMLLDLCFPVYGDAPLPADHASLLNDALARIVPTLHRCTDVTVLGLTGRHAGDRILLLLPWSELTLRLPDTRIGEFLPLSRTELHLGRQTIRLGTPEVRIAVETVSSSPCHTTSIETGTAKVVRIDERGTGA